MFGGYPFSAPRTLRSLLEMPLKSAPPRVHISNIKALQIEHNKDNNEFTIDLNGGKKTANYPFDEASSVHRLFIFLTFF